MAERWFLKLDGIVGESTAQGYEHEIEIESWSFGVSQRTSSTGARAGRPVFDPFQLTSRLSVASPPLLLACASGRHLAEAILTGVRQTGSGSEHVFVEYRLTDVLVATFQQTGSADGTVDQFALTYSAVTVDYTPQSPTGTAGQAVSAGFDIKKSKVV